MALAAVVRAVVSSKEIAALNSSKLKRAHKDHPGYGQTANRRPTFSKRLSASAESSEYPVIDSSAGDLTEMIAMV